MSNNKLKTLKVGILGEPNTGKSTLFNTLMNKKYSIVTRKAQTTIKKNSAVLVKKNKQIIFTDTPGVITYKKNINRAMFKEASNVAFEVDVILLLFNIKKDNIEKIIATAKFYDKHKVEVIILLNKIDLLNTETFYKKVSLVKSELENKILFSISGKKNIGVEQLINYLNKNKINLIRTDVGDRNIIKVMRDENIILGGEPSGHVILDNYSSTGDGILASLEVLGIMKFENKKLSTLANIYMPYPQIVQNFPIKTNQGSQLLINNIKKKVEKKIDRKDARIVIRKSGTENKIRTMIEAKDLELAKSISKKIVSLMKERT